MDWWKSVPLKLAAWRRFSPGEKRLLRRSSLALIASGVALRTVSFPRLRNWLSVSDNRPGRSVSPQDEVFADQAVRCIQLACRHLPVPMKLKCLDRSLALWWLLRREGLDPRLRVGVRRATGVIEAHAWVELQGRVLNDTADVHRRYPPFDEPLIPLKIS